MSLEPCVADRKKFDLDLQYGKVREKRVADMLQDKKIEVKSERDMWVRTGNIAIISELVENVYVLSPIVDVNLVSLGIVI